MGSPEGDQGRLARSQDTSAPPPDSWPRFSACGLKLGALQEATDMRTVGADDDLTGGVGAAEPRHSNRSLGRETRQAFQEGDSKEEAPKIQVRRPGLSLNDQKQIDQEPILLADAQRRRRRSRRSSSLVGSNWHRTSSIEATAIAAKQEKLADKQVSIATSNLSPIKQQQQQVFVGERERSSSLTSDYFSSSQNSPIVRKRSTIEAEPEIEKPLRSERKSATIYENPAFCGDAREFGAAAVASQKHRTSRLVQMKMRPGFIAKQSSSYNDNDELEANRARRPVERSNLSPR